MRIANISTTDTQIIPHHAHRLTFQTPNPNAMKNGNIKAGGVRLDRNSHRMPLQRATQPANHIPNEYPGSNRSAGK